MRTFFAILLALTINSTIVYCQNESYQNFTRNVNRYLPNVSMDELMPTGDGRQFIYSGSNIQHYGYEWNVSAFFNIVDGGLDHLLMTCILPMNASESYQWLVTAIKASNGTKVISAPDAYKDLLFNTIVAKNRNMMFTTISDVYFIVDKRESELVKLICISDMGISWLLKFPKSSLPANMTLPYEKTNSKKKKK